MLHVATRGLARLSRRADLQIRSLSYPRISLTQPVNVKETTINSRNRPTVVQNTPTEVTVLGNGLRVATQAAFGQYCTIGVFVDAGSRYEVDYPSGVTQFLSKTAMQSTARFDSREALMSELEQYGGFPDVMYFRDVMVYNVSVYSFCVPQAVEVLGEVVWRPALREEEVKAAQQAVASEIESYEMHPVPESLLTELVHRAAYRDNTLGLPSICTEDSIAAISPDHLRQYLAAHFIPSHMVLVGVNVQHDQLVELAQQHFMSPHTSWEGTKGPSVDTSISQYTGGEIRESRSGAPVVGPNPLPDLTHVAVALESSSHTNRDDFISYAVLNSLMGGGGSFSAGGPGKGMYTQLYLNVLNQYPWIYHAQALNHAYSDSGIFCIFGSAHPQKARDLTQVLCEQFREMTIAPSEVDLSRAKQQLQSSLMMNLESRLVNFEDIGRQVLAQNMRIPAEELCKMIECVTCDDIVRVATNMRQNSLLSLAALGDISRVPGVREAEEMMLAEQNTNRSLWSRLYR